MYKRQGFIYVVSSLGVTGVRSEIKTDIGALVEQIRAVTDVPCAVGFGISEPEQAKKMAGLSEDVYKRQVSDSHRRSQIVGKKRQRVRKAL